MKRLEIKKITLGVSLLAMFSLFILPTISVSAQETPKYKVLAPLPGVAEKVGDETTLADYVPAIFKLTVAIAAVFAVLIIVLGGIKYMSTDAFSGKGEGKDMAWNAVKGLLLVIAAWLILNTVNPNLLHFDLNIEPVKVGAPVGGGLAQAPSGTCYNCVEMDGFSDQVGIKGTANRNINEETLESLIVLDNEYDGGFTITEGFNSLPANQGGHQNDCHRRGDCVDIALTGQTPDNIASFIGASAMSGLTAYFEVESEARKTEILSSLSEDWRTELSKHIKVYPPKSDGTRQITGEHFSVYSKDPPG